MSTEHTLRALLASEHRKRNPNPDRIIELRRQITEARTAAFIEKMLATAPPLSEAARSRLATLLTGQHR